MGFKGKKSLAGCHLPAFFLPFLLFPFNIPKQTISTKKLKIVKNNLYFSTN